MTLGNVSFGIIIIITIALIFKAGYEYGKYSEIHKIYKREWYVIDPNDENEEESDNT